MLLQILGSLVGLALLVIGLPLTLSPIPLGVLVSVLGIILLVASNPLAAKLLHAVRERSRWANSFFSRAEDILPEELAEPLRETEAESPPHEIAGGLHAKSPRTETKAPPMERRRVPRLLR